MEIHTIMGLMVDLWCRCAIFDIFEIFDILAILAIFGPFWPFLAILAIFGHFGTFFLRAFWEHLGQFEHTWTLLGHLWSLFSGCGVHLGTILAIIDILAHFGTFLLGPILGHFGPFWAILGHFGTFLTYHLRRKRRFRDCAEGA